MVAAVVVSVGATVVGAGTSTGAVVTTASVVVMLRGGFTTMLRHSPWLPEVSTAATCTVIGPVRRDQEKLTAVAGVSEVDPSARTTYPRTATLSLLASHETTATASVLLVMRRFVTRDGGFLSAAVGVEADGLGDQPGTVAVLTLAV